MRGKRPFIFSNLKSGEGVEPIVNFIIEKGGLAKKAAWCETLGTFKKGIDFFVREWLFLAFPLISCPGTYQFLILSLQSRFRMQDSI
jgi:hypothetical protein